jgi:hypothetical protein
MHSFYGLGAFITPIIVKAYLNSNFDISMTATSLSCNRMSEGQPTDFAGKETFPLPGVAILDANGNAAIGNNYSSILDTKTEFTTKSNYAFWILSFIQLPVPFILLYSKLTGKLQHSSDVESQLHNDTTSNDKNKKSSIEHLKFLFENNLPVLQMTLLIAFLVFTFEGLQATHGGYIFSYAVEKYDLKLDSDLFKNSSNSKLVMSRHHHHHLDDAYITATFWAFLSIGRLISIFLATKFTASFMMVADIVSTFTIWFVS